MNKNCQIGVHSQATWGGNEA